MEFIIKPLSNRIEFKTHRGKYPGTHHGKYTVNSILVTLTSDSPETLIIMGKNKKPIEQAIINELNKKYRKKKEEE